MKNAALVCAVAAFSLLTLPSAYAQFRSPDTSPLGFNISWYVPSDSDLRDIRSGWLGATIQYNFKRDQMGRPTAVAEIEWLSADTATGKANLLPVRVSTIKRFGDEEKCWFVTAGVGIYAVRHKYWGYIPTTQTYGWSSDGGEKLGYVVSVGRELGNGLYVELTRQGIAKLSREVGGDTDFSGWTIRFGTRLAY
ncbi:MAG: hypothetical protein QHI38_03565 [Armatimonadota bacterium]|nr:hypothetical protein [Armatimonadota bacterium]